MGKIRKLPKEKQVQMKKLRETKKGTRRLPR